MVENLAKFFARLTVRLSDESDDLSIDWKSKSLIANDLPPLAANDFDAITRCPTYSIHQTGWAKQAIS